MSHALTIDDFKVQAFKIWGGGSHTTIEIPINAATQFRDLALTDITETATSTAL